MITVNGLLAGGMGGVGVWGDECSVNGGDGERLLPNLFVTALTEGALTLEVGSLFQYFRTLTKGASC